MVWTFVKNIRYRETFDKIADQREAQKMTEGNDRGKQKGSQHACELAACPIKVLSDLH